MLLRQFAFPCMLLTASLVSLPAQLAQAGPLIDWLFHKPAYGPAVPVGAPYPVTAGYAPSLPYGAGYAPYSTGYAPYSTGYAPYSTGYAPAQAPYSAGYSGYTGYTPYGVAYPSTGYRYSTGNMPAQSSYPVPSYGTYYGSTSPVVGANGYGYLTQRPPNDVIAPAQAVLPPTNPVMPTNPVTLVPDYRSTYARTPVTYYRPVLTTDPNTGAQVVALAPCSSFEYQTQRVPTWGLTQVYNGGATLPAVTPTAPIVSPTYSLPRGGIPLSGPVPSTQPYTTAYGTYPSMATSTITPVAPSTSSIITPASPNTYSSPTPYTSGYSNYASNYGNYSALQPGAALPPASAYPTQPYSPYYGNGVSGGISGGSTGSGCTGGGSTGGYIAPPSTYSNSPYGSNVVPTYGSNPGLAAPNVSPGFSSPGLTSPAPAPGQTFPNMPSTGMPGTGMPGTGMPGTSNGLVLPPSNDPAANAVPNFPSFNSSSRVDTKPQLQNIVQQPMPSTRSFNPASPPAGNNESQPKAEASQGLLPIPLPDDFKHEPRWNPGLLKDKDTTASVTRDIDPQVAWGSKPIRWASHKTSTGQKMPEPVMPELPPSRLRSMHKEKFTPPVTEIPEVNFQPPKPARLELEEAEEQAPVGLRDK